MKGAPYAGTSLPLAFLLLIEDEGRVNIATRASCRMSRGGGRPGVCVCVCESVRGRRRRAGRMIPLLLCLSSLTAGGPCRRHYFALCAEGEPEPKVEFDAACLQPGLAGRRRSEIPWSLVENFAKIDRVESGGDGVFEVDAAGEGRGSWGGLEDGNEKGGGHGAVATLSGAQLKACVYERVSCSRVGARCVGHHRRRRRRAGLTGSGKSCQSWVSESCPKTRSRLRRTWRLQRLR